MPLPRDQNNECFPNERRAGTIATATSYSPYPKISKFVFGILTMASVSAPTRDTRVPSGPSTLIPPPL